MAWLMDKTYFNGRLVITPFLAGLRLIAEELKISFYQLDSILMDMNMDEEDSFWEAGTKEKKKKILEHIKSKSNGN